MIGDIGKPEDWVPVESYEDIAGVWERQSEGFWHARYEIYEDGSYYWGNASHNYEDINSRIEDERLSQPEAWDVVFEELKESNSKELDGKEDIVHYSIGKCPGFVYAEMYETEDSEQYVFNFDRFELSAEGCRMRRYNEETGEYDIFIRQENRFVGDVFKNLEE